MFFVKGDLSYVVKFVKWFAKYSEIKKMYTEKQSKFNFELPECKWTIVDLVQKS